MHARREIEDAILRYCRGVDRCDGDLVRSAYHDDGHDDHGELFRGTVAEYVPWVLGLLRDRFTSTMHTITNLSVDVDGDTARSEAYCIAYHTLDTDAGPSLRVFGCRYVDKFENRPPVGWRIAHRRVVAEWQVEHQGRMVGLPSGMLTGRRDRTDPGYA
ncbi:nuclear transport factor 2 family protein [Pseudonocardia sp. K10HN5]|uniref:Nuclear transport factor 2 family protein n=1 Tax=Pseudonocardia acidicola TaxID=2724939 RepID=A0ABX1SCZ3_9PSEU|nr:nuclear transport factor 2 family protein [Pseudonocardia acidicola]NMH98221.1 nuclear transport factor 2 family protein [Pseudonocardia acidicola]